jgi:hypothetical protein
MNYSMRGLLTEAELVGKLDEDNVRLRALPRGDDEGRWTAGISYWSGYVTVIDLQGAGTSDFRQAS